METIADHRRFPVMPPSLVRQVLRKEEKQNQFNPSHEKNLAAGVAVLSITTFTLKTHAVAEPAEYPDIVGPEHHRLPGRGHLREPCWELLLRHLLGYECGCDCTPADLLKAMKGRLRHSKDRPPRSPSQAGTVSLYVGPRHRLRFPAQ
jgi:hypothetical protein